MKWLVPVITVLVAITIAHAQPAGVIGKPLPDSSLPVGTVLVRVLSGNIASPTVGVPVTLTVERGATQRAITDATGRARFDGIAKGSRVTVKTAARVPGLGQGTFQVPDAGGVRVMLSSARWRPGPPPRESSGRPMPLDGAAAGTLEVQLTYDDLEDRKPPANVPVTLVGYAADDRVSVTSRKSGPKGNVTFTGLDRSGSIAYFAMAQLPRRGKADRLLANQVTPTGHGWRVVLSAEERTSKAAPVDLEPAAVPAGKVRVTVEGVPDPAATIEVVDVATGKVIGHGTAKPGTKQIDLDAKAAVVYARTTARGNSYRSRPIVTVADRGATLAIIVMPRLLQRFDVMAQVEGDVLAATAKVAIDNNSWIPYAGPIDIPLPAGSSNAVLYDDAAEASLTKSGLAFKTPLPTGGREVVVEFRLPAIGGKVKWELEWPFGTIASNFLVAADPGVKLVDLPGWVSQSTSNIKGASYLVLSRMSVQPHKRLAFAVQVPKLAPKQLAIARSCGRLSPERANPLAGKPMPDFTATQLDGTKLTLSKLRGKLLVVSFNATWNSLQKDEETFPRLAAAVGNSARIVVVSSDKDPAEVKKAFGGTGYRVVLDPPNGDGVGPITARWGISKVPETFVVDRTGKVRLYIVNQRDWSTPDAIACIRALAAE